MRRETASTLTHHYTTNCWSVPIRSTTDSLPTIEQSMLCVVWTPRVDAMITISLDGSGEAEQKLCRVESRRCIRRRYRIEKQNVYNLRRDSLTKGTTIRGHSCLVGGGLLQSSREIDRCCRGMYSRPPLQLVQSQTISHRLLNSRKRRGPREVSRGAGGGTFFNWPEYGAPIWSCRPVACSPMLDCQCYTRMYK